MSRVSYIIVQCCMCKKEFERKPSHANRTKNHFCSNECRFEGVKTVPEYNANWKNRSSEQRFFAKKIQLLRSSANRRSKKFEITWQDLYAKYLKQKGNCFYTGLKLNLDFENTKGVGIYDLSVDRKNNNLGYTKENVVLCLYSINTIKNYFSGKELKMVLINFIKNLK